jgi:hypothetical protein
MKQTDIRKLFSPNPNENDKDTQPILKKLKYTNETNELKPDQPNEAPIITVQITTNNRYLKQEPSAEGKDEYLNIETNLEKLKIEEKNQSPEKNLEKIEDKSNNKGEAKSKTSKKHGNEKSSNNFDFI